MGLPGEVFRISKVSRVTTILFDLGLPSFATVRPTHNYYCYSFYRQWTVTFLLLIGCTHTLCLSYRAYLPDGSV